MIHTLHPRAHRDWALLMRYLERLVDWLQDHGWTLEDEDTDDPDRICLNLRRGDEDCWLRLIRMPQQFGFGAVVDFPRKRYRWNRRLDPRDIHTWLQERGIETPRLYLQPGDVVQQRAHGRNLGRFTGDLGIVTQVSPEAFAVSWGGEPAEEHPWTRLDQLRLLL